MSAYIRGRLLRAIPVMLGVLTLVFLMIHLLPGDPAVEIASRGPGMSPEAIQRSFDPCEVFECRDAVQQ